MSKQHLLTPYNKILTLKQSCSSTYDRGRADNEGNVPTDDLHGFIRAASAGLIITEGAQVSLDAIGYINTAGIHTDEQVEGWKKVTTCS
jgi:N-ethylmaleimide reductase